MKTIKVILVDDCETIRKALKIYLRNVSEIDVVADFSHAEDALAHLFTNPVDLVVTDLEMGPMNGFEFIKNINLFFNTVDVVVLSSFSDQEYVFLSRVLNVKGYLSKQVSFQNVRNLILKTRDNKIQQKKKI